MSAITSESGRSSVLACHGDDPLAVEVVDARRARPDDTVAIWLSGTLALAP